MNLQTERYNWYPYPETLLYQSEYHTEVNPVTNWYIISKHAVCVCNQEHSLLPQMFKKNSASEYNHWSQIWITVDWSQDGSVLISTTCPPVVYMKAWRLRDDARSVYSIHVVCSLAALPKLFRKYTGGRACPCLSNTSSRNVKYHCKGVKQSGHFHQNIHIKPMTQETMVKASAWPGNMKRGRHRDTLVKMETPGSHLSNSLKLLNTNLHLYFTGFSHINNTVEFTNYWSCSD